MKTKRRRHVLAAVAGATAIAGAATLYSTTTHEPIPTPTPAVSSTAPTSTPKSRFPDASNTGVPAGTTLAASGSVTVTTPGAVIDGKNVSGLVAVKANNVTIKRSRITGGIPYPVRIYPGFTGTVIEDSELVGVADECSAGISNSSYTARRLNVHGCKDGLKVASNVTIEDSYIHDQRKFPGTHNDGIQSVGGKNVVIRGNRIEGPFKQSTSAMIFQTNLGPVDNVLVENNLLSGGSYTVYFRDKKTGYGPPTNVRVLNNQFVRNSYLYGLWSINGTIVRTGNVWSDTGQPV